MNVAEGGNKMVKVWDLFVRFFHWSLVLSFTAAFVTAEYGYDEVHEYLGYFITLIVVNRLFWGFMGSKYARFANFIFPVSEYVQNFKAIVSNKHEKHYVGHNPLGGLMVFALIAGLVGLAFTGLTLLGWSEYTGPVWALGIHVSESFGEFIQFLHYELPDVMLVLIGAHILGVVVAMKQHGENLIRSMFTGFKKAN